MNIRKERVMLLSVFLALAIFSFVGLFKIPTAMASSDDWPMFRHDLAHTGYSTSTGPTTNQTLWTFSTGAEVFVSPAVVDGKVYVGSEDHNVYCLNATSGAFIWNYTTGDMVDSSPAVADSKVYVGSIDGKVYCLNATSGAFIWNYTTGDGVASSPAVADGKVYVGSYDYNVYCLNATSGAFIWNYTTGDGVTSTPAIVDGKVYVGSDDFKVYCLNATSGAFIWNYTTGDGVASSPAVADGKVYVGSWDDNVYCLDAATGTLNWTFHTGKYVGSSPAVVDGKVYIGSYDGKVYCFAEIFAVTFTQTGLDSSATGTVVTVDGINYTYADLPKLFEWELNSNHTYAYADLVSSSTEGKRFSLINVTGPTSPITVTEDVEITGNYQTQWQVTFTHTGLDSSANETVVTVNGTAKNYGDLPFTAWYNESDTITYSYEDPASSSTDGKRFDLTSVTGPTSPITVSSKTTVTGVYVVQWQVTITTSGMDATASGTVVTINGVPKNYAALPYVDWLNSGSTLTYSFESAVESSTTGKQFKWTSNTGPSSPKTVNAKITVTGNYVIQWWVVFAQTGLDGTASGTIVTVNGANKVYVDLPFEAWYDYESTITYSYVNPAGSSTSNKRFNLTSVSGSSSPITVSASETVTGNYQAQWKITFTQTGLDASITGTIVTINGTAKTYAQLPYVVWVNHNNVLVFEYNATFSINEGKRIALKEVTGATSPLTVTASATITGVYVTQWKLTFTQTGLDSSATSVVFTVKGTSVYYANLPYEVWCNNNDVLVYAASNTVTSSHPGQSFVLSSVMGYASPITVTEASTVTANYATKLGVTFRVTGIPNIPKVVVTIDGVDYIVTDLPKTFSWAVGSHHQYSFVSPIIYQNTTYLWTSTTGCNQTTQSGTVVVPAEGGEVAATYVTSTNTVTFRVVGLPSNTIGVVLTVDGVDYTLSDLPITKLYATGQPFTYVFRENITVNNVTYSWLSTAGLSTERGDTLIMPSYGGSITAFYGLEGETLWGESTVASSSNLGVATRYAKEWKSLFAEGRFWIMYSNSTSLFFQSAPYSTGQIKSWTSATNFGPANVTVLTYDFAVYYEEARNFVHCAFIKSDQSGDPSGYGYFWYRRGQPKADGSIAWTTDWQKINNVAGDFTNLGHLYRVSLCTDSNGVPFLGFYGYRIPAGGDGIFVVKASSNNGTFTSPTATYFAATSTGWPINYPINIVLVPLTEGKVLAVYYYIYTGPTYYLKSRLWSGSAWGSAVNILPQSGSKLVYDDRAMAAASDLNQTAYLTYLNPDASEIYAFKYVLGTGWSGVQTVTDYTSTTSFPAVGFRSEVNVYWAINGTVFGSRLVNGTWSASFYVKALNATEVYCDSINSFTQEYDGKFGIAITYRAGTDYRIAMLYQPYVPVPVTPPPAGFPEIPIMTIIGLIGVVLFILSPYMMAVHARDEEYEAVVTWFAMMFVGLGLMLAWWLGGG